MDHIGDKLSHIQNKSRIVLWKTESVNKGYTDYRGAVGKSEKVGLLLDKVELFLFFVALFISQYLVKINGGILSELEISWKMSHSDMVWNVKSKRQVSLKCLHSG